MEGFLAAGCPTLGSSLVLRKQSVRRSRRGIVAPIASCCVPIHLADAMAAAKQGVRQRTRDLVRAGMSLSVRSRSSGSRYAHHGSASMLAFRSGSFRRVCVGLEWQSNERRASGDIDVRPRVAKLSLSAVCGRLARHRRPWPGRAWRTRGIEAIAGAARTTTRPSAGARPSVVARARAFVPLRLWRLFVVCVLSWILRVAR